MTAIKTRAWWGATVPTKGRLTLPVQRARLHHSVTLADACGCTDSPQHDQRVIERIGRERFGRYPYNDAAHPGGIAMTGAGTTEGAHARGRNHDEWGIVAIGDYERDRPPASLIATLALILVVRHAQGVLPAPELAGGHRDIAATKCPGGYLYERIPDINALALEGSDMLTTADRDWLRKLVHDAEARTVEQTHKAVAARDHHLRDTTARLGRIEERLARIEQG